MLYEAEEDQHPHKINEQPKHDPIFEFKLDLTQTNPAGSILFVSFYGPASIFLESCLKNDTHIGQLNFLKAKQHALANLYQRHDNLFLVFNDRFQPMHQHYLADFLLERVKFNKLILIDQRQASLLSSDRTLNIRYIKTSKWNDKVLGVAFRENVTGPAADLIITAQQNQIECVYYVAILQDYEVARSTLDIFKVFEHYDLKMSGDPIDSIKKFNRVNHSGRLYL